MSYLNRKPRIQDSISQAGWLFADLMLALAVIFLLFSAKGSNNPVLPTPTYTMTPSLTPTVTYTPTPTRTITPTHISKLGKPGGSGGSAVKTPTPIKTPIMDLSPKYCKFVAPLEGLTEGDPVAVQQVEREIKICYGDEIGKRVAGVVITIGYHRDPLGTAFNLANSVNKILKDSMDDVFEESVMKGFGWSSTNELQQGLVVVEAYFINNPDQK